MRDIAITVFILGCVPFVLRAPWTGILVFAWISMLNPHRFAWGFAYNFPFAMIIAAATIVGILVKPKEFKLPMNRLTFLTMALPIWMTVTTVLAFDPALAYLRWTEVFKVFAFVLVAGGLLRTRRQLEAFIWVIVGSIAFYGVKGGIFTIVAGGGLRVYGPPGESFLSDNNAISLALTMVIPLMYYLSSVVASKWVKRGLFVAMLLCGMAVLGSQSRGAFLAIIAMLTFLWLKSQKKVLTGALLIMTVPLAIAFMPDNWTGRMKTIETYEHDESANMRLNAWGTMLNIAKDRPVNGGGFEIATPRVYQRYSPDPRFPPQAAHSIYFQMLGEHGFVGLFLFLALGLCAWIEARRVIRERSRDPALAWRDKLARAIQISLVGYAVGGAFVNVSYWDLPYYEIMILMVASRLHGRAEKRAPVIREYGRFREMRQT